MPLSTDGGADGSGTRELGGSLLPRSMLLRTVRMTFRPDALPAFFEMFEATRDRIAAQPGCRALALWADPRFPNILTTVSEWDSAEALDAYRASELFTATWARTKAWFAAPPVAHSHVPA